jgi:hypothetical protein
MGPDVPPSSSREGVSVCSREHSVDEARKTASTKPVPRRAQPHRRTLRTLAHVEDDRAPKGFDSNPCGPKSNETGLQGLRRIFLNSIEVLMNIRQRLLNKPQMSKKNLLEDVFVLMSNQLWR